MPDHEIIKAAIAHSYRHNLPNVSLTDKSLERLTHEAENFAISIPNCLNITDPGEFFLCLSQALETTSGREFAAFYALVAQSLATTWTPVSPVLLQQATLQLLPRSS